MPRALTNPTLLGLLLIAACSGGTEVTTDTDGDTTGDTSGTTSPTTTIATTTATSSTTASETSTTTNPTGEPTTDPTTDPTTSTTTSSTSEPTTSSTTEPTTGTTGDPGACDDGIANGDETDVDCGGSCEPCEDGLGCGLGDDCVSGVCGEDELCAAPACDDEALNGDETDVDCGGSCDPCEDGLGCLVEFDCISGVCTDNLCALPSCEDGLKNGLETAVDCGGGECAGCADGEACMIGEDCESGVCDADLCVAATCDDGVQNGDEEDVDCGGGSCAPCILEGLIINEVDYDNVGSDNAEFVEIYNNTGDTVDLTGIALVLVNGSNDTVYGTIDLSGGGSLEQGKYLVVAPDGFAVPPETILVNFPGATNNLQNGAPDGLALVDGINLKILDALSYEGSIDAVNIPGIGNVSLVEGDALGTPDSNANQGTLSRIPNGNDTNNADTDWAFSSTPTPGDANKP